MFLFFSSRRCSSASWPAGIIRIRKIDDVLCSLEQWTRVRSMVTLTTDLTVSRRSQYHRRLPCSFSIAGISTIVVGWLDMQRISTLRSTGRAKPRYWRRSRRRAKLTWFIGLCLLASMTSTSSTKEKQSTALLSVLRFLVGPMCVLLCVYSPIVIQRREKLTDHTKFRFFDELWKQL